VKRLADRVRKLSVSLWTLIVPPSVWAVHFLFSYLWAALNCAKVGRFAEFPTLYAVGTVAALVVILAAGTVAWVQQHTPGDDPPHEQGTAVDRLRFLAKSTLLLAGLSFVAVIFTAAPVVFLTDCR
jgi:L-asparagine transporter-like permease